MPTEQDIVNESDVFKAIGHLDEATKTMTSDAAASAEDQEEIIGFFTLVGRILKHIFEG